MARFNKLVLVLMMMTLYAVLAKPQDKFIEKKPGEELVTSVNKGSQNKEVPENNDRNNDRNTRRKNLRNKLAAQQKLRETIATQPPVSVLGDVKKGGLLSDLTFPPAMTVDNKDLIDKSKSSQNVFYGKGINEKNMPISQDVPMNIPKIIPGTLNLQEFMKNILPSQSASIQNLVSDIVKTLPKETVDSNPVLTEKNIIEMLRMSSNSKNDKIPQQPGSDVIKPIIDSLPDNLKSRFQLGSGINNGKQISKETLPILSSLLQSYAIPSSILKGPQTADKISLQPNLNVEEILQKLKYKVPSQAFEQAKEFLNRDGKKVDISSLMPPNLNMDGFFKNQ